MSFLPTLLNNKHVQSRTKLCWWTRYFVFSTGSVNGRRRRRRRRFLQFR